MGEIIDSDKMKERFAENRARQIFDMNREFEKNPWPKLREFSSKIDMLNSFIDEIYDILSHPDISYFDKVISAKAKIEDHKIKYGPKRRK